MKRIWQLLLSSLSLSALLLLPSIACQVGLSPPGGQDVLRLWDTGPITLDPAMSNDISSHTYIMQIFSGLVRLDQELKVAPDIAESWERSSDGKTYTFHLRRGVKFHDGKEVKAVDFKYSWERASDPATGSQTAATYLGDIVGVQDMLARRAKEISGVKVIDEYTLQVTIDAPKAYFLSKLAYPTAFVVDRDNVRVGKDWWRKPNGTGPFRLKEWAGGQRLTLERNEFYYGQPAKVRQVVFYLLAGSPMAMYERGQIDVVSVSTSYFDQVSDEANPLHNELAVTPELSLFYIGFNTAKPPFDDVNVRRAFCHAVDKERVVKSILRGMAVPAYGVLPPGMPGYNEALKGLGYDPQEAKELIKASKYGGLSNLPPIVVTVPGYGNDIPEYLGAVIQQWQENLGVEVSVRQLETENFIYNLKQEKDDIFMLGWIADYPDPHNFLDTLFYSGRENNAFEYSNPELDSMLDRAAVEQDESARLALYQEAEKLVVEEAACFPLWFGANYILVKPYVKGYEVSPLGVPDLSKVYLEQD